MLNSRFSGFIFFSLFAFLIFLAIHIFQTADQFQLAEALAISALISLAMLALISFRKRSLRKWVLPSLCIFFFISTILSLVYPLTDSLLHWACFLTPLLLCLVLWIPLPQKTVSNEREQGSVKWFHSKKGYGFISRPNGDDLFVHYRGIQGNGHKTLTEGQMVEYHIAKNSRGLQAKNVIISDD